MEPRTGAGPAGRALRLGRGLARAGAARGATSAGRGLVALVALVTIGGAACGTAKPAPPALSSSESWCPDGFEVGPSDTCFTIPDAHDATTPVLVYLHGSYAGHGSAEEWSLVRSATDRGFAVVMPRGKRGLCAWKAELADHFCWPQEIEDVETFKRIVKEWDRVLWQVDALLEPGAHKRYVLGFGNGASFGSFLATKGLFDASAYAVVDGVPLAAPAARRADGKAAKEPPPILFVEAGDASQAGRMAGMHAAFTKAGWPHAFCAPPASALGGAAAEGSALSAADLDGALRFFRHEADGTLKPAADRSYPCESPLRPAAAGGSPAPSAAPTAASRPAPSPRPKR
jgi:poly(3-hydroxybutyrate) depolymerase